jgi:hypothetical protein
MRDQLLIRAGTAERAAAETAEGWRSAEARRDRIAALSGGCDSTAKTLASNLSRAAAALQVTAKAMAGSASGASTQAAEVGDAAAQMAGSVNGASAAAEQLRMSINAITRDVAAQAQTSGQAADAARRTDEAVRALAESTGRIGRVVELISSIASQTRPRKTSSSFLKKRTKKLLLFGVCAAATHTPIRKSFCFFFQKEALSSFTYAAPMKSILPNGTPLCRRMSYVVVT